MFKSVNIYIFLMYHIVSTGLFAMEEPVIDYDVLQGFHRIIHGGQHHPIAKWNAEHNWLEFDRKTNDFPFIVSFQLNTIYFNQKKVFYDDNKFYVRNPFVDCEFNSSNSVKARIYTNTRELVGIITFIAKGCRKITCVYCHPEIAMHDEEGENEERSNGFPPLSPTIDDDAVPFDERQMNRSANSIWEINGRIHEASEYNVSYQPVVPAYLLQFSQRSSNGNIPFPKNYFEPNNNYRSVPVFTNGKRINKTNLVKRETNFLIKRYQHFVGKEAFPTDFIIGTENNKMEHYRSILLYIFNIDLKDLKKEITTDNLNSLKDIQQEAGRIYDSIGAARRQGKRCLCNLCEDVRGNKNSAE